MSNNKNNEEIDRKIHDAVFIESIDRKERIIKFLIYEVGLCKSDAHNEKVIYETVCQIKREGSSLLNGMEEDIDIFISEYSQENDNYIPIYRNTINKNHIFNRDKAKDYIEKYWKNYNPAYPSFNYGGGDCANFVSQVLYAGGMPWVDDGNPSHYTWHSNWYCKPGATNKDGDRRISLSWKVAAAFKSHWIKRAANHYIYTYAEALNNFGSISNMIHVADAVQFCYPSGVPWHTLVVTGFNQDPEYNLKDIVLASHTVDSNSRSLYRSLMQYAPNYRIRLYIIKE